MIAMEERLVMTVYAQDRQSITLHCEQCGKCKVTSIPAETPIGKRLKVRCGCGHVFCVRIEGRYAYRKLTTLPGTYVKLARQSAHEPETGRMRVEDLSRWGLRVRTAAQHTCQVDDLIRVSFHLDDPQHSTVHTRAIVKWVNASRMGAAFLDHEVYNDTNRALYMYCKA